MSRHHAMVRVRDRQFVLVDLGSTGGTTVGDRKLEGRPVTSGGVVTVGETQLRLVTVDEHTSQPASMTDATLVDTGVTGAGVLVVESGPDSGQAFPLAQADNVIGRDPSCEVTLRDSMVSRMHALIRTEGERFVVFDLGSRAGTNVNGEALFGYDLSDGDTIVMGRSQVRLTQPGS